MVGRGPDATDYRATVALSLPWGTDLLPPPAEAVAEQLPLSNRFVTESKRQFRPVPVVRVGTGGDLYVAGPDPPGLAVIAHYDRAGDLVHVFDLDRPRHGPREWSLVHFAPDHDGGLYVLEYADTGRAQLAYRLRRLDGTGKTVWSRTGISDPQDLDFEALKGLFTTFYAPERGRLYLPAHPPQSGVARLDTETGQTAAVIATEDSGSRLFVGAGDAGYYGLSVPGPGGDRFCIVRVDLRDGTSIRIEMEVQYRPDIAGVDAAGNLYLRLPDAMARLSPAGRRQWQHSAYGIARLPGSDDVFVCEQENPTGSALELAVTTYGGHAGADETVVCRVPQSRLPFPGAVPRLVAVDAGPTLWFHAGETQDRAGTLLSFGPSGQLQGSEDLDAEDDQGFPVFDKLNERLLPMESRTAFPELAEIDGAGSIYLPVTDPRGLSVVAFRPIDR